MGKSTLLTDEQREAACNRWDDPRGDEYAEGMIRENMRQLKAMLETAVNNPLDQDCSALLDMIKRACEKAL